MMPAEPLHIGFVINVAQHFVRPPMPGIMPMILLKRPELADLADHACGSHPA